MYIDSRQGTVTSLQKYTIVYLYYMLISVRIQKWFWTWPPPPQKKGFLKEKIKLGNDRVNWNNIPLFKNTFYSRLNNKFYSQSYLPQQSKRLKTKILQITIFLDKSILSHGFCSWFVMKILFRLLQFPPFTPSTAYFGNNLLWNTELAITCCTFTERKK